ncbi:WD40 repeat-like protein [Rhizoclosmatium globosum]|uniref:WD40 repeat-like protein n=1 Tax=Rhizoclosmatium globosum TaxID=329046 RepID=A0A1Y2CLM9_9FUNG|nr:WD40 repeat-like protein [Rhizoclosmatium globosum]|eukprot:ORY47903.1 WD40 repeat-like protein [Rhizoclosmatium globosum]
MRIYYTMPPSQVSNRKLLSPRAVLSNILKRVKNPETDLVFDFHSFAIVSVTNEQANTMPTVLEISEFDIDALKTEIMKQFQLPNQGFTLHYIDSKTQRKVAVDKSEVLERAILSSSVLVYELATGFTPLSVSSGAISLQDSFQQDAKSRQQYDIFISYNWGTKSEVTALVEQLKLSMPSLKIWMDHKQMQGNIYSAMSGGISSSKLVLACLSKGYLESVNCNMEINFSADLKKPIIPAYFFDEGEDVTGYKQSYGVPFMITAGSLYSDFKRYDINSPKWQSAFSVLCNEIRHVLHPEPIVEEVTSDSLKLWLNPVDFVDDIHAYASEYVKGTRMWVVDALNDWVDTDERAMWMNGGAGTGKSLIAYSLLVNLPDTYKVGSIFFCRHNDERKRDPIVLVATMIWNLYSSVESKEFRDHIETEMKADNVRVKQENKQSILRDPVSAFERIIVEGLKKVSPQERKLLIVVDALDELDILTRKSVLTILTSKTSELPSFVKLLTTGRPESDIYHSLQSLSPFILSPSAENNKADLDIYIRSKVEAMWTRFRPESDVLIEKCFTLLSEKADGLFIYARTLCEYLRQQFLSPFDALEVISTFTIGPDGVYTAILDRAFQDASEGKLNMFRRVFSVIFGVQKPLGLLSLVNVGNLAEGEAETIVAELRSVLKIENGVISVIHKSFKDYLTDTTRCNPLHHIKSIDFSLSNRCLEILCSNLHQDMGQANNVQEYSKAKGRESPYFAEDVQYALEYWSTHFALAFQDSTMSQAQIDVALNSLHKFCTSSLPYYLESLLLLNSLNSVFRVVKTVTPFLPSSSTSLNLLTDLQFIATNFRSQLLSSPHQVYRHALIAVPTETEYYKLYSHLAPARLILGAEANWGPKTFMGHTGTVLAVLIGPHGDVFSGSQDGTVRLWDFESGECYRTFMGHSKGVTSIAYMPDGFLVTGSLDGSVKVWNIETGVCEHSLVASLEEDVEVMSVCVSGDRVVSGHKDGHIRVWDLETRVARTLEGHSQIKIWRTVRTLAASKSLVVSGGHDSLVKVWDLESGSCIRTFDGHSQLIRCVVIGDDGDTIISSSDDKTIKMWSLQSGLCLKTLEADSEVYSVALSHDGSRIAAGCASQNKIFIWSAVIGEKLTILEGHSLEVRALAFSSNDKILVSGSRDDSVRVWNLDAAESCQPVTPNEWKNIDQAAITCLAASSKAKIVVSGSYDGQIDIWSTETGKLLKTLKQNWGFKNVIRALVISPDAKLIATVNYECEVCVWDWENGKKVSSWRHKGYVQSVGVSADGLTIASAGIDKVVKARVLTKQPKSADDESSSEDETASENNQLMKDIALSAKEFIEQEEYVAVDFKTIPFEGEYNPVFSKLGIVIPPGSERLMFDPEEWILLKDGNHHDRLFDSRMERTDASGDLICWTHLDDYKIYALELVSNE